MAGTLVEITDQNFEQTVLKSDKPVVIDFWATWCGPCRMVAPIFEQLSTEYGDRMVFGKLDTDANPDVSGQFAVYSIPTMIVFSGGQEVERTVGAQRYEHLKQFIENALAARA
ncbi:MAG TPA: thioredoxin [Ktedonobacterales bacterium]